MYRESTECVTNYVIRNGYVPQLSSSSSSSMLPNAKLGLRMAKLFNLTNIDRRLAEIGDPTFKSLNFPSALTPYSVAAADIVAAVILCCLLAITDPFLSI